MLWENLDKNLILLNLDVTNSTEVFETVGGRLMKQGYCKNTYVDALVEREKEFPTGINVGNCGIAIPHTDRGHVIKGGIAIGQLKNPVHFFQMGTTDIPVEAKLIFMLAIDDPERHLPLLQRILQIVQDEKVLSRLVHAKSKEDIVKIIQEKETEIAGSL